MARWSVDLRPTIAYHHQSNGMVERWHRTFKQMMQMSLEQSFENWQDHVQRVCCAFRSTICDTTAHTPNFMIFGREISLPIDCVMNPQYKDKTVKEHVESMHERLTKCYLQASREIEAKQRKYKKEYDKAVTRRKHPINVGDHVWARSFEQLRAGAMGNKWASKFDQIWRVFG